MEYLTRQIIQFALTFIFFSQSDFPLWPFTHPKIRESTAKIYITSAMHFEGQIQPAPAPNVITHIRRASARATESAVEFLRSSCTRISSRGLSFAEWHPHAPWSDARGLKIALWNRVKGAHLHLLSQPEFRMNTYKLTKRRRLCMYVCVFDVWVARQPVKGGLREKRENSAVCVCVCVRGRKKRAFFFNISNQFWHKINSWHQLSRVRCVCKQKERASKKTQEKRSAGSDMPGNKLKSANSLSARSP